MADHRFKVGDRVCLARVASMSNVETFLNSIAHRSAAASEAVWEVLRLLPSDESGRLQYRVRDETGTERLVQESELEPA